MHMHLASTRPPNTATVHSTHVCTPTVCPGQDNRLQDTRTHMQTYINASTYQTYILAPRELAQKKLAVSSSECPAADNLAAA